MKKCKGGCQMKSGGKTCMKCGCDMEDEEYEKGEKEEKEEMRSGGMACMKCGGKMHKSGGTVSSCMKCGGGKYTFGGKVKWAKKYANGGEVNSCPPGFMKIGNDCVEIKTVVNMFKTPKQYGLSDEELLKESEILNNNQQFLMPGLSDEEIRIAMDNPNAKEMPIYDNTTTPNKFLPFYLGQDRYDNGGHMSQGLDDVFYGLNEQKFYPTGLENRPVNQNMLSYKYRKDYSDKSASKSGAINYPKPRSYMFGGKVNWSKKKINNNQYTYASGGMIKRADGSYSQRGLWDNIRANAGSGKKPTKQMLEQEKKIKQNMSFGGAVSGMKKYFYGGETDNTKMTDDTEIQLGKGAFNVSEPAYDANKIMSRVFDNALSIKESEQPITKQTGYKEEVEKNKVVQDDKSLPNWGRAKKEQQILNELIRKDIASGKAKMGLLEEDDIIGDYTLGAMREYEASGQYKRPELFKDKWLAEYKKQWDEMQKSKSSAGNQESKTESSWGEKMFGFNKSELANQPEMKNNTNAASSSQFGWADKYLPNKYKENKPGWGVLAPESQKQNTAKSTGWSKEQLLKEGGVEMDSKELSPKDFDTYFPIKGFTKSKKGIRATGRDRSDAYFDAVEKSQYFDLNGLKANTSINLINELLTKSKKVIIIPKGQDKHGRDLNDIYLQDENDPSKYHALDSLGVVNREAIFGEYIGEESRMTDRQKMITGQAKEKGGFKYSMSPSIFRKLNSQESPKQTTTKSKEEPLFPLFEELYKTPKEDVKSKSKSTSVPKSTEKTTLFPSFSKIMNSMNSATTNNTERDNQYEQLARDIEADYETEQKQSYKNFGKKSSAAAAKSAEERSKSNKGYAPISVNPFMPTLNNENTQVKKEPSDYVKNAKGQLIATDFNNQQKEKKAEEKIKRINEGADKYINLNLKKAKNREDIKYNINAINDYHSKIEEALSMLSGTTDNSKQGFNRMTATESIRYNPETKKSGPHFEHVSDEEYERLTVIHVFLENELDKIYKDPRYKNESAFTKKRILQRKLHESQKKMTQMQYEMKKQINDFN